MRQPQQELRDFNGDGLIEFLERPLVVPNELLENPSD